jgi:hypothetical protein
MRSRNSKIARTIASVLMSLLFLTAVSPAATKPITAPEGRARFQGNLYVANYSGNEILIYSPSYQQMKSITKSVSGPAGIAFDPSRELLCHQHTEIGCCDNGVVIVMEVFLLCKSQSKT